MQTDSCTNTHYNITDLVNHGVGENAKTWISLELKITFLWNKKNFNLCHRWQILRSFCFEAEVTFKFISFENHSLLIKCKSQCYRLYRTNKTSSNIIINNILLIWLIQLHQFKFGHYQTCHYFLDPQNQNCQHHLHQNFFFISINFKIFYAIRGLNPIKKVHL